MRNFLLLWLMVGILVGCGDTFKGSSKTDPTYGYYKIGNPYKISGKWYRPHVDYDYEEVGIASWYGKQFHGRKTANGATFDMFAVSAAHRTLPLPSYVTVENLENGKKLKILVNDRGPFYDDRIIDLSREAADQLGMRQKGTARVKVSILRQESSQLAARLQGNDTAAIQQTAAPTGQVTSSDLEPVVGTAQAAEADNDSAVREVASGAISGDKIYIQVGAYGQFDNAIKAEKKLQRIGNVEISQTQTSPPLHRVRLGPFRTATEAENSLRRVKRVGFEDAQIIVVVGSSN